jgi:glycosyltransferase involved in cell wall biosynthesis
MKLAIIIPAKNEEKTLPYLINSIKEQTFKDFKIIVADADSKDKTKEIAKKYGCEIVKGGNPSEGRNRGIERAIKKGFKVCFMIDADSILPSKDFLEQALREFYERGFDLAGTLQNPFDTKIKIDLENVIKTCKSSRSWKYKLIYRLTNLSLKTLEHTRNPTLGNGIFEKTKVYESIGGFDENIEFGEDSKYARCVIKKGYRFGILKKPDKIFTSPRRFEEKGFWKMFGIYLYFDIGLLFGHEFKINGRIKYFKNGNNKRNNKF